MFIKKDFLLQTEIGRTLYHDYAKDLPIIDFHNHLDAKEIANNHLYTNLTEAWLLHDHYKWRLMRGNGITEALITGNGNSFEKTKAFCSSLEGAIMNAVNHFSHMELKRFFDINLDITGENADRIWKTTKEQLASLGARDMLEKMQVEMLCTTDDPLDSLGDHGLTEGIDIRPTFRPDKALKLDLDWYRKLTDGKPLKHFSELIHLLEERLIFFKSKGCLLSDHSLEGFRFAYGDPLTLDRLTEKLLNDRLSEEEALIFRSMVMVALGKLYHKHNIAMQVHIGAMRNNSKRQYIQLGADSGYDSISDQTFIHEVAQLMSHMDEKNQLPKTILYNINPADNTAVMTLAASFNSSPYKGKIQFGSAWWFNDHFYGIREQLTTLASHGILGNFIGMVTDSRSYLSFVRHEYFRRVLCDLIGEWAEAGMIHRNIDKLGQLVADICYNNIINYLNLGESQ